MARTLFDKIWDAHVVAETPGGTLLYIDRHLGHDGSSRALRMLAERGLPIRRPDKTLIVLDHVVPTVNQAAPVLEPRMREMLDTVRAEAARYRIGNFFDLTDPRNGISHVAGPEQGFALPGTTLVCGDSHTSTHGAFGALAFGIGASEVEHVLATQALLQRRPGTMLVELEGGRPEGVHAKDVILALIGRIGIGGGTGCVIEYAGKAVREMSMEERMTVCNMTIEAGARAGMMAPDETTYEYLAGRPLAPAGADREAALAYWRTLPSDPDAAFDRRVSMRRGRPRSPSHLGHEPVHGRRRRRIGSEDAGRGRRERGGGVVARPRVHGPRARHPDGRRPPGSGVHRARAPTAGSRTFASRPATSRGGASRTGCTPWWCRGAAS